MKVWIIEYRDWEDVWIMGVYSSKKKAEKGMEKIKRKDLSKYKNCEIDEYDVE